MIEWISTNNSGKRARGYYITLAVSKSGRSKTGKENPHALCIRFSEQAQKDLRLIAGDRLHIGIDKVTKQVVFKRTTEVRGAFRVSGNKSSSGKILSVQCSIELPWHESVWVTKKEVHDEVGHIAIDVPSIFEEASC